MGTTSTGLKKFPELNVLSVGIGKPAIATSVHSGWAILKVFVL